MGLVVENLTFSYRCFPVLKGVDFSVEAGNLVCMLRKEYAVPLYTGPLKRIPGENHSRWRGLKNTEREGHGQKDRLYSSKS